jgi:branched-chain amino acid transport system ATP-binding protein
MTPTPVLLRTSDVTVRFGGVAAVDTVSFDLAPGEILGLVGPNGAGKSTLFGAIAGAVPLASGRVEFDGHGLAGRAPHLISRSGVARTFQKVRLFNTMSVLENVLVAASVHHRGNAAARTAARDALGDCALGDQTDRLVTELPLADRKKVEIARALAARPRLLLLDEMMNGLNPEESDVLIALIAELPSRGVTVMLVEHVLPVVRALCGRLLVLHHGKLLAVGAPEDVLSRAEVREAYLGKSAAPRPTGKG